MRLITAWVPTLKKSSGPGVSTVAWGWATTTSSLSSRASTASTAATDAGRPTVSGIHTYGKSTIFFSGSKGRLSSSDLDMVRFLLGCYMQEQHAVATFYSDAGMRQVARQFNRSCNAV